jgi:hypothetical protein
MNSGLSYESSRIGVLNFYFLLKCNLKISPYEKHTSEISYENVVVLICFITLTINQNFTSKFII